MRKTSSLLLTVAILSLAALQPAKADDWHHHGDFHDFHDFHGHGFDHWHEGNWVNGFHEGRNGWWWVVDGAWYFYPAPIYPYPDPYTPSGIVVETAPAGTQAYYYCANPAGYYPYVPQCAVTWQRVISAPAAAPQTVIIQQQPAPAPQAVVAAANPHDVDMQKLNGYAAKLQAVDPNDPHAGAKLKTLEKQVEAFRQSLFKKDYNAMDILKDAEDLKKRIGEEREAIAKHTVVVAPAPTTTVAPPPTTLPAGSTVTFPPPPQ